MSFEQFTHTYSDKEYKHTTMVRHKGTLIAFAMDGQRRIYYAVLDLSNQEGNTLDRNHWPENPSEIIFPREIVRTGIGVIDPVTMPTVKKGSRTEASPDSLSEDEIDGFLSRTSRLTQDASFQVLSDGRYVYLFRQAIGEEHPDTVYQLGKGAATGNKREKPLVNNTLLVDRFVLVENKLESKREVRYQRSRNKHQPASNKDSLGAKDLEGRPFLEPTQSIGRISHLENGWFHVLLLPTQVASIRRWQIFAYNSQTEHIDAHNIEHSPENIFKGTFTDHKPQSFVFEGRTIASGLSALLYHQQEQAPTGYDQAKKPLKKNARVMLAVATAGPDLDGELTDKKYIAALDFAVSRAGKLATVPADIHLPPPLNNRRDEDLDTLNRLEKELEEINRKMRSKNIVLGPGQKIQPDADNDEWFGYPVAIRDDKLMIVSMPGGDNSNKYDQLNINYYQLDNDSWRKQEAIPVRYMVDDSLDDSSDDGSETSVSIALSENTVFLGIPIGKKNVDGSAHVFELVNGKWVRKFELQPSNAGFRDNYFGNSISISGDRAVIIGNVKMSGKFTRDALAYQFLPSQGRNTSQLRPEILAEPSETGDRFARSVALSGEVGIIGTPSRKKTVNGAAHIFHGTKVTSILKPPGESVRCGFGYSVAIDGDTVVIGDSDYHLESDFGGDYKGTAHIFELENGEWRHQQTLQPGRPDRKESFGTSVAIRGDMVIVGAPQDEGGAVYIFRREGQEWVEKLKIDAPDSKNNDYFGLQVAVDKNRLVVAAAVPYVYEIADEGDLLNAEKAAKQQEIDKIRTRIENGVRLPMELLHTDSLGLTVSGGLLGFAYTRDAPLLFDSATGKLALYYRGKKDQFFAAYYDTNVTKARYTGPKREASAKPGKDDSPAYTWPTFIARSAGLEMNAVTITVEDGSTADTCTVIIKNTTNNQNITERWPEVSRSPAGFARVLNGRDDAFDYAAAETGHGYSLEKGSLLFIVNPDTANGPVQNGAAVRLVNSIPGRWVADAPGSALSFDGREDIWSLQDPDQISRMDPIGDLTLETWLSPQAVPEPARVIHHHSQNACFTLGIEPRELDTQTALKFNGKDDFVSVNGIRLGASFTLEAWIYLEKVPESGTYLPILSRPMTDITKANNKNTHFDFQVRPGGQLNFFMGYGEDYDSLDAEGEKLQAGRWYHVAVSVSADKDAHLYLDGQPVGSKKMNGNSLAIRQKDWPLLIGFYYNPSKMYWQGSIDEVRVWNVVREPGDIDIYRTERLTGNEPGLVGYWHFAGKNAADYSDHGNHGSLHGVMETADSPPDLKTAGYAFTAGVGYRVQDEFITQVRKTTASVPCRQWNHLAAAFKQSHALHFAGDDYLECQHSPTLDIRRNLTLEIFLQMDTLGRRQALITKGQLHDGTEERVPYALFVEENGRLTFVFEDSKGKPYHFTSENRIKANTFYKIGVTREHQVETKEEGEKEAVKITVDQWAQITILVQEYAGEPLAEQTRLKVADAGSGRQPLTVAAAANKQGRESALQGFISEIRLWNVARNRNDICGTIYGNEEGLVSWWKLEEGEGNVAGDAKSGNHAVIKGAQWKASPDPQGSNFTFYLDGLPAETEHMTLDNEWGQEGQFTLGAMLEEQEPTAYFHGEMDEVRLWKIARTEEQIQDNLFTRLKGEKADLLAYYPFDEVRGDEAGDMLVRDNGLRGNDLAFRPADKKPTFVLSPAPISDDIAQVRSALAQAKTQFHDTVFSRPAVQEYGDMQYDLAGNLNGVLKRCYGFIDKKSHWQLLTGYKVGNLIREWVSQVQANPQIVGFIEGAPPVPSENLTQTGKDYSDASSIEFEEAENVLYTYASSVDEGFDTSLATKTFVGIESISMAGGLVFSTSLEESDVEIGAQVNLDTSNSQLSDASVRYGRNTSKLSKLSLRGTWELKDKVLNPAIGPRFVPDNIGMALVQSDTMDVFALRLLHNHALVAYQMQPNPDIPPDWNIILFPINPTYIKQGTLDGKVGMDESGNLVTDPHYKNATNYGQYSYFRPIEAYQLKYQIEREQQELATYFEMFSTEQSASAGGGKHTLDLPQELARRNLVNTYVWTADGGFFAETTSGMESIQETTAGSFSLQGMAGVSINTEIALSKAAIGFEMDALFGGHLTTTKTKGKETENSFGLKVEVTGESDLKKSAQDKGEPPLQPGKVNAYRFMTFYLEPKVENFNEFFDKVVKQDWLWGDDPNAVALRQAYQKEEQPPCWRILHRVTFVSRILPEFKPETEQKLDLAGQAMRKDKIDSNWELINQLKPQLDKYRKSSYAEFTRAVENTLKSIHSDLVPYKAEITAAIAPYFEVFEEDKLPG